MAEDLYEVREVQREQATTEEIFRQEHAQAIQDLLERLTKVEIQLGTMDFESQVQK